MFRKHSIAKRVSWTTMLVSGAALLLACAAFIGYDIYSFRRAMVYNLSIQAQIAGTNSISALVFDDPDSAQKTLAALEASPTIITAGILRLDGRPFATYSRNGESNDVPALPVLRPGQTQSYRIGNGSVLLLHMILFQGKPTGIIYIQSSMSELYTQLRLYAGIAGIVLALSFLGVVLISPVFQREIVAPVEELAAIATQVSAAKDYSVRAAKPDTNDEVSVLVESFNGMLSQIQERDAALRKAHDELELRVQERTHELNHMNKELEAFSYSVSHDLRAPLRAIDGFSQALLEDYADKLDSTGQNYLDRVRLAAQRMSGLIDDLLNLSRVTRSEIRREPLNLSAIVKSVAEELKRTAPERNVTFAIAEGLTANGDSRLLRVAIENLLGNSWKYTSAHQSARIEFGMMPGNGHANGHGNGNGNDPGNGKPAFFIRDDGAGFDPQYTARLFGAFQRLHAMTEFPGTGIGLATVQRIIRRHGGSIWAEGAIEKGATFYFTL